MAQLVRVNAEKHSAKMLSELHRMQQDRNHCDLIIKVQTDVYHAHKTVLSAGSEYFRAMLAHETKENLDGEITFKDVDSECVKNCIRFIYSGEFEIPNGKIKDLLHVGIMLQLDEVKQVISGVLAESISVDNYYSTRSIAEMYELEKVLSECRSFFTENLMAIANQPEFGNMAVSRLIDILRTEKLKYSEEEKLAILLKWAEKNPKSNNILLESIKQFKLDDISSAFLRDVLKTHLVISNDFAIYKWISDHLLETSEKVIRSYEEIVHKEYASLAARQNAALNSEVENKTAGQKSLDGNGAVFLATAEDSTIATIESSWNEPKMSNSWQSRFQRAGNPNCRSKTAFLKALLALLWNTSFWSIPVDESGFAFVKELLGHRKLKNFRFSKQEVYDIVNSHGETRLLVRGGVHDNFQIRATSGW